MRQLRILMNDRVIATAGRKGTSAYLLRVNLIAENRSGLLELHGITEHESGSRSLDSYCQDVVSDRTDIRFLWIEGGAETQPIVTFPFEPALLRDEADLSCFFCRRTPEQISNETFYRERANICKDCVTAFHQQLQRDDNPW